MTGRIAGPLITKFSQLDGRPTYLTLLLNILQWGEMLERYSIISLIIVQLAELSEYCILILMNLVFCDLFASD
jgi:hypothetical protein